MEGPDTSRQTHVTSDEATSDQATSDHVTSHQVTPAPTGLRMPTEMRMRAASIEPPSPPSFNASMLGARIAALRQRHGWTQRRLAEEAGVSHGYVAQLELGRLPNPGKARLDAIAHALLLRTADALLSDDEDEVSGGAPGGADSVGRMPIVALEPATSAAWGHGDGDAASSGAANGSHADRVAPGGRGGNSASAHATRSAGGGAGASGDNGGNVTSSRASDDAIAGATATRGGGAGGGGGGGADAYGALSGNVLGMIEQVRGTGTRQLPVFRWGSCGDPRDRLSPPDPDRLEYPPPGRESLIGDSGFGVVVKGDSMAGRGIHDGDVVWVNPDRPYALGKVVLALATSDEGGEAGMVVKTYARTEVGECLVSETEGGRSPLVCHEFKVIGPVVGITSWRLPL